MKCKLLCLTLEIVWKLLTEDLIGVFGGLEDFCEGFPIENRKFHTKSPQNWFNRKRISLKNILCVQILKTPLIKLSEMYFTHETEGDHEI